MVARHGARRRGQRERALQRDGLPQRGRPRCPASPRRRAARRDGALVPPAETFPCTSPASGRAPSTRAQDPARDPARCAQRLAPSWQRAHRMATPSILVVGARGGDAASASVRHARASEPHGPATRARRALAVGIRGGRAACRARRRPAGPGRAGSARCVRAQWAAARPSMGRGRARADPCQGACARGLPWSARARPRQPPTVARAAGARRLSQAGLRGLAATPTGATSLTTGQGGEFGCSCRWLCRHAHGDAFEDSRRARRDGKTPPSREGLARRRALDGRQRDPAKDGRPTVADLPWRSASTFGIPMGIAPVDGPAHGRASPM